MRSNVPDSHRFPIDAAAAHRKLLQGGSRSFFAASLLLPRAVAAPATALYAFCRVADDAIDRGDGADGVLDWLHERLQRIYAGAPLAIAEDRSLADVVAAFAIPRALPEALLEGFAWDARGRRYETIDDVQAYAARVAGTVGAMMAIVMGQSAPDIVARAVDLGIAMQLTNIARDVGEDARAGRLYLPCAWMVEAGIDPDEWLARPFFSDALGAVVRRILTAADDLYRRADSGIAALPLACRPGIFAARLLYAEIGREVARNGFDSVSRRAVVPPARKAMLLAPLARAIVLGGEPTAGRPVEAASFILDAVASLQKAPARPPLAPWWNLPARIATVVDLFERLERREQPSGSRP